MAEEYAEADQDATELGFDQPNTNEAERVIHLLKSETAWYHAVGTILDSRYRSPLGLQAFLVTSPNKFATDTAGADFEGVRQSVLTTVRPESKDEVDDFLPPSSTSPRELNYYPNPIHAEAALIAVIAAAQAPNTRFASEAEKLKPLELIAQVCQCPCLVHIYTDT